MAVWRAPLWQRIVFPAVGVAMVAGAFWPEAGEPYEPLWVGAEAFIGAALVLYALRPKLTLFEDAVYIRGQVLSRLIPIEDIAVIEGGYGGLGIWWGDGHFSQASTIGEQTNIDGLPGSDGRRHTMRTLILATRDTYLERMAWSHRLTVTKRTSVDAASSRSAVEWSTTLHPKAAMFQLAGEIPTPILAEILGLSAQTVTRWAALVARDGSQYTAARGQDAAERGRTT